MSRSSRQFGRKKPSLKPEPKILIVCEDSKSSLNYLNDAARHYRISDNLKITHCGKTDPAGIVDYGASCKTKYDKIYCVIDRDTHQNFEQALGRARDNNIVLIISYPCFEYWLFIHFEYSRKPYNSQGGKSPAEIMKQDLKAVDPIMADYDKGSSKNYFSELLDRLGTAIRHGKRSLSDSQEEDESNPSTQLHSLIERFESNNFH